jgi:hypothetical protein
MSVHTVEAYPETCQVSTYKRGKTVWIATGTFMGEPLQQQGRSEATALRNWKDIAEFRYRSS